MAKIKDLTGQRFGRLIVFEPSDKRTKSGDVIWKCKCDCGNYKEAISSVLARGDCKSCGCLSKETTRRMLFNDRTGEIRTMKNGLKATIIAYRDARDIDIQFENGNIALHEMYHNYEKGKPVCPLIVEPHGSWARVTNVNVQPIVQFLIDTEDLSVLEGCYWHYDKSGYIQNTKRGKLHRLIVNAAKGENVDHVNHDVADNRKGNLRICTQAENTRNSKLRTTNTSGYKGVTWNKDAHKWQAQIKVDYKHIYLGVFEDKVQAAKTYNTAALKYHGEFAKLNEI